MRTIYSIWTSNGTGCHFYVVSLCKWWKGWEFHKAYVMWINRNHRHSESNNVLMEVATFSLNYYQMEMEGVSREKKLMNSNALELNTLQKELNWMTKLRNAEGKARNVQDRTTCKSQWEICTVEWATSRRLVSIAITLTLKVMKPHNWIYILPLYFWWKPTVVVFTRSTQNLILSLHLRLHLPHS